MKILILSPFLPYPPDSGAKVRTFNIIRSLHGHDIHLLTFADKNPPDNLDELKKYCSEIYVLPTPRVSNKSIFLNFFSLKPLLAVRFFNRDTFDQLKEIVRCMDIVIFESLLMAEYRNALTSSYGILDELNIEFIRAQRRMKSTSNILKKLFYYAIFYRLKKYELKMIRNYELILVCSENDKKLIEKYNSNKKVAVIPNVIDTDYFYPVERVPSSNKIIFVGTMWYEPNADALRFFIQKIYPLIKKEVNDVELLVIGEGGSRKILKHNYDPNIKIINYADDIRPHFVGSKVFIAPIRMGSGTRLKILTAMAMGLPVVSTTVGCEGLDVINGENIVIADEPLEMKESIVKILRDEDLRRMVGKKGRELVEDKYSLKALADQLNKIFNEMITKK